MTHFKPLLATFILSMVLVGCSPQKRAQNLLKRAERICPECNVTDTVIIEGRDVAFETPISLREPTVLSADGITLTVHPPSGYELGNEVRVKPDIWRYNVRVDTDTVYVDRFIPCPDSGKKKKGIWDRVEEWLIYAGILITALFLLRMFLDKAFSK